MAVDNTRKDNALDLPRFSEQLATHAKGFPRMSFWRMVNGYLPPFGRLLVRYPDLLQALTDDAIRIKEAQDQSKA